MTTYSHSGHPIFTTAAWDALGNMGLHRNSYIAGWMVSHDLAVEAYETCNDFCPLSFDEWRTLVSAVHSGMPVWVTTQQDNGKHSRRMSIVKQILFLGDGYGVSVRSWGFATTLSLAHIVHVEAPEAEYNID